MIDIKTNLKAFTQSVKNNLHSRFAMNNSLHWYILGLICVCISSYFGIFLILDKIGNIQLWRKIDIIIIFCISIISYGFRNLLFFGFTKVGDLIKTGAYDMIKTRPTSSFIHIMGEGSEVGGIAYIITGIIIIMKHSMQIYAINGVVTFFQILIAIICASLVQGAITVVMGGLAFVIQDISGLNALYISLRETSYYPTSLFKGVLKIVLFTLLPFAFVGYIPANIIFLDRDYYSFSKLFGYLALLSGPIFLLVSIIFWKFISKLYTGTGN